MHMDVVDVTQGLIVTVVEDATKGVAQAGSLHHTEMRAVMAEAVRMRARVM